MISYVPRTHTLTPYNHTIHVRILKYTHAPTTTPYIRPLYSSPLIACLINLLCSTVLVTYTTLTLFVYVL